MTNFIKGLLTILIVSIFGLLLISSSKENNEPSSTSEIWNSIENKILYSVESFAGESYTFFEARAGEFVIIQTYGSGRPLLESYIKRVEIKEDVIVIEGKAYRSENNSLVSENHILKDMSEIYLINYEGKQIELDLYLAVQSVLLDEIPY